MHTPVVMRQHCVAAANACSRKSVIVASGRASRSDFNALTAALPSMSRVTAKCGIVRHASLTRRAMASRRRLAPDEAPLPAVPAGTAGRLHCSAGSFRLASQATLTGGHRMRRALRAVCCAVCVGAADAGTGGASQLGRPVRRQVQPTEWRRADRTPTARASQPDGVRHRCPRILARPRAPAGSAVGCSVGRSRLVCSGLDFAWLEYPAHRRRDRHQRARFEEMATERYRRPDSPDPSSPCRSRSRRSARPRPPTHQAA